MSWIHDEQLRFAWLTHDGELILFDELQSEIHGGLCRRGVAIDRQPLICLLRAIRAVTRDLLGVHDLPTPHELCALISGELREQRTILAPGLIRVVLAEYLTQLRRFDIARVQDF